MRQINTTAITAPDSMYFKGWAKHRCSTVYLWSYTKYKLV